MVDTELFLSCTAKESLMHIEPGYINAAKVLAANTAAISLLGSQAIQLAKKPQLILRTLLAAVFFSLFMQSFHMPVGPSELHFVGAMPIYLTLGFIPTLIGFGLGLLAQGLLFEPADLVHLGVNTLSLAVPLCLVHAAFGKHLGNLNIKTILKFDAVYYSGVTLMVGFWLAVGEVATPLTAWATFTASYLSVVIAEPLVTYAIVKGLSRWKSNAAVRYCFNLHAI
jgi:ABC-type Co2+ transport system permease subunit